MAIILIKRRREPLEVDDTRAKKVKNRWLGINGIDKAEPTEQLDLGEWAGEYGQISSIEIPRPVVNNLIDPEIERKKEYEENMKIPVETRARSFARFITAWFMRSRMKETRPPEAILEQVYKLQLAHLLQNPSVDYCPANITQHLLEECKTPDNLSTE